MSPEELYASGAVIFLAGFLFGWFASLLRSKKRFGLIRKIRFQKRLWNLRESTRHENEEVG